MGGYSRYVTAVIVAVVAIAISALVSVVRLRGGDELPRAFTVDELKRYDSGFARRRIFLAIRGMIFDVTAGERHYGKNRTYEVFAGRDATRAFAGLDDPPLHRTDDLTSEQFQDINGWVSFYNQHKEYRYMGWLEGSGLWTDSTLLLGVDCTSTSLSLASRFGLEVLPEVADVTDRAEFGFGSEWNDFSVRVNVSQDSSKSCDALDVVVGDGNGISSVQGVVIGVRDVEIAEVFYRKLGFEIRDHRLRTRQSEVYLELRERVEVSSGRPVIVRIAILDVRRAAQQLWVEHEVRCSDVYVRRGEVLAVSLSDPDGNEVLLLSEADLQSCSMKEKRKLRRHERDKARRKKDEENKMQEST